MPAMDFSILGDSTGRVLNLFAYFENDPQDSTSVIITWVKYCIYAALVKNVYYFSELHLHNIKALNVHRNGLDVMKAVNSNNCVTRCLIMYGN